MASYDLLIIGAGPAAWSCAMTARQRGLTTVVACAQSATSWLQRAERIDNYPGLPQISGKELLSRFRAQAADMGVVIIEQLARQIMPNSDIYMTLVGNDIIESRAIVLAMGAARPKLLPGEEELLGRGVSWCGTCDGMFYRGKRVAVIAQGPEAVSEANFLAGLCSEVVYFGAKEDALDDRITVCGQKPEAILGESTATGLKAGGEDFPFDGVFIFRETAALSTLLPGLEMDGAFIRVDRRMKTNLPGVFAAGDCTGQPLQVAKAVGEGCVAAISAATT